MFHLRLKFNGKDKANQPYFDIKESSKILYLERERFDNIMIKKTINEEFQSFKPGT